MSVIIPNWNGARHLPVCLDAMKAQTHADREIVLVDNASGDDSVELARRDFPEVRVVKLASNGGFSAAVNEGIGSARGDLIALLNNDTEADPNWLAELVRAAEAHPEFAFFASKLLLFDRRDVIHSAGDYYRVDAIPGNRGVWRRDDGQFDREEEVFSACGGAAAYRRSLLEAVGPFDESLWMYCEDVDYALRSRLLGYSCLYVPTARVYHRLSASGGGPLSSFFVGRNVIEVAAKNLPLKLVWRRLPWIVGAQLSIVARSLARFREPAARATLRGQMAAMIRLPSTLGRRRRRPPSVVTCHELEALLVGAKR